MRLDPLILVDRSWPLLKRLMAFHAAVYRFSGGRIGGSLPGLPQVLVLEHRGRRSGRLFHTPLLYARDGERLVLIASKGGYPNHPQWYLNLKANPDTLVRLGQQRLAVRAREAEGEERQRLWQLACNIYPSYNRYQARTPRQIPVVVLEPRPEGGAGG